MKCVILLGGGLVLALTACGDDSGTTNNNNNANDNRPPECGNGEVEVGETCDDGAANSDSLPDACRTDCREAYCGDGVPDTGELCDDGNADNDGCLTACLGTDDCCVPNVCGDGYVDPTIVGSWPAEACDDGNTEDGDACRGDCGQDMTTCGDGNPDQGEQCDEALSNSDTVPDACRTNCRSAACGDGVPDSGDECDDGNFVNGDGCSSGCTLDAALWRQVVTTGNPPGRAEGVMAYDASRDRTVLFGGWNPGPPDTVYGDTWELDGSTWQEVTPVSSPLARSEHTMTYDASRNVVVMFAGWDINSVYQNDLWEYDAGAWVPRNPTSPPQGRAFHAMAYDSQRGVHVLFGGYNGSNDMADTWEYNGVGWSVRFPSLSPPARSGHAMTYDAARERVVLFGGDDTAGGEFGDTWEYDGTTWIQRSPAGFPVSRSYVSMSYHTARKRVVIYGGFDEAGPGYLFDTWEWTGTNWLENSLALFPPARDNFAIAYDSTRRRLVLFGGEYFGTGYVYRSDTWEYYLQSQWPDENCANGQDDDTDGLVDCDDPDCIGAPGC